MKFKQQSKTTAFDIRTIKNYVDNVDILSITISKENVFVRNLFLNL